MQETTRWKKRPPGSNWGDFGADDQAGRLNLITPEKVLQGIAEVHVGLSFNLSLPLDTSLKSLMSTCLVLSLKVKALLQLLISLVRNRALVVV